MQVCQATSDPRSNLDHFFEHQRVVLDVLVKRAIWLIPGYDQGLAVQARVSTNKFENVIVAANQWQPVESALIFVAFLLGIGQKFNRDHFVIEPSFPDAAKAATTNYLQQLGH